MPYSILPPKMVEKSICPHCGMLVALLIDEDHPKKPAFYLCWPCKRAFQVGVGPVPEYKEIEAATNPFL